MGDEEEQTFETTDAGASTTYPLEAGQIRKGGHIMIKGNPCKVIDVSTSKTGKHGHAKCHFVATDIFTGKKMEELVPSSHNLEVPNVSRQDYSLLDVDMDDEFVSLMDDAGETKDDLKLPNEEDIRRQIIADFEAGKTLEQAVGEVNKPASSWF